ncbi:GIY-YIG nuclease family protein [Luteibaculum oceani]|uniref:GIY-YIG nuclease family protein n=1 Tax=Luteibaculum oceani TaxID=1294296 RepID=A0A5C6V0Y7_9FLAO|nr:GIY-YIG nuclease family protein [Luteibaculum oceani]TXC78614.1 GIY-YIG nuclease family protein [Luteibaculum oceani]
MFQVYILQSSKSKKYYIGYTGDSLENRLSKHNRPHKGYTARHQPWELVYHEEYSNKTEAIMREKKLKGWKTAKRISELIQSTLD